MGLLGYLGTVVEEPTKKTIYTYSGEEQRRSSRTDYSLRNLPRQDYSQKQRGPFTSLGTSCSRLSGGSQPSHGTVINRAHSISAGAATPTRGEQQYEAYQEQVRIMHEQHVEQMGVMREVLKADRNTTNTAHYDTVPGE